MVGCGGNDMTPNLISNASMETFPGNKFSSFTTLLPTPMTLSRDWQVALLEILRQALVCDVTAGKISVSRSVPSPESPVYPTNHNLSSGRSGIVLMRVPRQFRKEPAMKFSTPEVRYMKAGCYSSIDDIMKSATQNSNEKNYRQKSSRTKAHQVSQQTFLGKLIRRRRNFA